MLFYTNLRLPTNKLSSFYAQKQVLKVGVLLFLIVEVYETYDKKI